MTQFYFNKCLPNPEFKRSNLTIIQAVSDDEGGALRSCLIYNNAEKKTPKEYVISRVPKWLTTLTFEDANEDGELIISKYETDDLKGSKNRKIKAVNKFCDFYEPKFKSKEVSILFHTFTRLNYAKSDMRRMMDNIKYRYESINRPIRGYIWVLEVSEFNHIHYHLLIACNRLNVRKMPQALKFNDLWGQRTGVEFIKKSARAYLTKYLSKSDAKILSQRNYSCSRKLI